MIKSDVSQLYKTKMCKKYSTLGYCPYGMRCQFIHDIASATPAPENAVEFLPVPAPAKLSFVEPVLNINSTVFKMTA